MEKKQSQPGAGAIFFIASIVLCVTIYAAHKLLPLANEEESHFLNIYNWYGLIPADVIEDFEKETGIRVRYDLYDSNEIVEAKLFAGNSGYDLIFPSASPYVVRQIEAGIYQKLDKELIPNLKNIDPLIYERMRLADPKLEYVIPYYWGTFGFAYVEEEVRKRLPNAPVHSYRMLFDPEIVSHFSDCGVTLLDEAVDVYPAMLAYIKKSPISVSEEDLMEAQKSLLKIRPHIKRFSGTRFMNELVSGESCVAQAWSGEAQQAQDRANEVGKKITIRYVVPEEGGTLWIDSMVIPKGAPHPKNAHVFINFLFRPDIGARIVNSNKIATSNKAALKYIDESIKNDPTIYPDEEVLARLTLDKPQSMSYERQRTRLWTEFRLGKN